MVEYRTGAIVVLLEKNYEILIQGLAQELQDREGQAVIWRSKKDPNVSKPINLFMDKDVDRQDLIGKI